MTSRCFDFPGPRDHLAVATSKGWIPFDDECAAKLAASAMMLAAGPDHVQRLQREAQESTAVQT